MGSCSGSFGLKVGSYSGSLAVVVWLFVARGLFAFGFIGARSVLVLRLNEAWGGHVLGLIRAPIWVH